MNYNIFCEEPKGFFPCGKCRACTSKKANEKMLISIFAAAEYVKKGQFLTLTYSDEYLPYGLKHEDFSGFMKRLRRVDGTTDVKFFVAGEYGEKSGREHFHLLVYNHRFDIDLVERTWSKGFVYDGTLTPKSMKYVSGYICKKGYDPETGKRAPYGRISCNVPTGLSEDEVYEMCRTGKVYYNGRSFSVPTNWRRRYIDEWRGLSEERYFNQYNDFLNSEKRLLTPTLVKSMMDYRDLKFAMKRKSPHSI